MLKCFNIEKRQKKSPVENKKGINSGYERLRFIFNLSHDTIFNQQQFCSQFSQSKRSETIWNKVTRGDNDETKHCRTQNNKILPNADSNQPTILFAVSPIIDFTVHWKRLKFSNNSGLISHNLQHLCLSLSPVTLNRTSVWYEQRGRGGALQWEPSWRCLWEYCGRPAGSPSPSSPNFRLFGKIAWSRGEMTPPPSSR